MFGGLEFTQLLILVLLGLLFFKEQMVETVTSFFRPKSTSNNLPKEKEDVPAWAKQLMQHFNHDTTDQHNLTHAKLDRIENKIDKHNEIELGNSGKLDELIRAINR